MTKHPTPTRILIIDDELELTSKKSTRTNHEDNKYIDFTVRYNKLLKNLESLALDPVLNIEVYASKSLIYPLSNTYRMAKDNEKEGRCVWEMISKSQAPRFEDEEVDVLILDLYDVIPKGQEGVDWKVNKNILSQVRSKVRLQNTVYESLSESVDNINSAFQGAAWYLRHITDSQLFGVDRVFIVTNFSGLKEPDLSGKDDLTQQKIETLRKYLDPFTGDDSIEDFPFTKMFEADDSDQLEQVSERIRNYCEARAGNFQAHAPGARQFAAHHDLPILIIGEPHTRRRQIAEQIGRSWLVQEKIEAGSGVSYPRREPVLVDCSVLPEENAHARLFGRLPNREAENDAPQLGVFISALGFSLQAPSGATAVSSAEGATLNSETERRSPVDEYASALSGARCQPYADDAQESTPKFTTGRSKYNFGIADESQCRGAIILHEFHNLPISAQTGLLRFRRKQVVQPQGFPGVIDLPKMKVICTTSHPLIAEALNIKDLQSYRSVTKDLPVREDLLLALKGQLIRSPSLRLEEIGDELNQLLRKRVSEDRDLDFAKGAIETVKEKLRDSLPRFSDRNEQDDPSQEDAPLFGQHYELERLVDLAVAYVEQSESRGMRTVRQTQIKSSVVEAVWGAAVVPGPEGTVVTKPDELKEMVKESDRDDWIRKTSNSDRFYAVMSVLAERLDEYWWWKDLKDELDDFVQDDDIGFETNPAETRGKFSKINSNIIKEYWDRTGLEKCGYEVDVTEGKIGLVKKK
jgi:hypothetical protein